jgi:hypothetical protein
MIKGQEERKTANAFIFFKPIYIFKETKKENFFKIGLVSNSENKPTG